MRHYIEDRPTRADLADEPPYDPTAPIDPRYDHPFDDPWWHAAVADNSPRTGPFVPDDAVPPF